MTPSTTSVSRQSTSAMAVPVHTIKIVRVRIATEESTSIVRTSETSPMTRTRRSPVLKRAWNAGESWERWSKSRNRSARVTDCPTLFVRIAAA